jgi:hypothetical protein
MKQYMTREAYERHVDRWYPNTHLEYPKPLLLAQQETAVRGVKISIEELEKMANDGDIESVRVGEKLAFAAEQLDELVVSLSQMGKRTRWGTACFAFNLDFAEFMRVVGKAHDDYEGVKPYNPMFEWYEYVITPGENGSTVTARYAVSPDVMEQWIADELAEEKALDDAWRDLEDEEDARKYRERMDRTGSCAGE